MTDPQHCPDCHRLEAAYERTIRQIYLVVETRFRTLADKIRKLHYWQDERDLAIGTYYHHRRWHRRHQRPQAKSA